MKVRKITNKQLRVEFRFSGHWSWSFCSGFLATVFANFDVSPEMTGIGTEHSSPGSNQQTNPDSHYPDVVTDEPSRKFNKRLVSLYIDRCFDCIPLDSPTDMEGGSPNSQQQQQQQQQVIVNNANADYNGLPAEPSTTGTAEEACVPFNSYDYATNIRLANGYKFPSGGGSNNPGNYTAYPTSSTSPVPSHQVNI